MSRKVFFFYNKIVQKRMRQLKTLKKLEIKNPFLIFCAFNANIMNNETSKKTGLFQQIFRETITFLKNVFLYLSFIFVFQNVQ